MTTVIKTKNSTTTTTAPSSLAQGELAVNITDKKVWVGNAATTPVQLLGTGADGSFTNLAYSGTLTGGTGVVNLGSGQFYKDASGNVGIGTSSTPSSNTVKLVLSNANGGGIQLNNSGSTAGGAITALGGNGLLFYGYSGAVGSETYSERMRIDSSGNVGIGTSSPSTFGNLAVVGTSYFVGGATSTTQARFGYTDGTSYWALGRDNVTTGAFLFKDGSTERMRIDSSGNLLVGTSSLYSGGERLLVSQPNADWSAVIRSTTASSAQAYGMLARYETSPNGTSNWFFRGQDSATARCEFRSNGGLANFSANNVNLSDERTKTNIQLAGSYLNKICAIPVKTFLYKDQTDSDLNLGVIAQDVEMVAPELVDVSGFGDTPEDGIPLKTIYQTDLQYALMKCIQEQQAIITELKTRIEALETK
jgi:hypothetical protein